MQTGLSRLRVVGAPTTLAMPRPPDDEFNRLPPHAPEAEAGLLGCCLLDAAGVRTIAERFGGASPFYDLRYTAIWRGMLALHEKGVALDPITLVNELRTHQTLDQVGGLAFVAALADQASSAANLPHYLDIVREKFLARLALRQHTEIAGEVLERGGLDEPLMAKAKRLQDEFDKESQRGAVTPRFLQRPVDFDEAVWAQFRGSRTTDPGLPLPIDFRFKIRPQEATLVTGDDGSGKSTLLSFFMLHLMAEGMKTLIASFEVAPPVTLWILASQLLGRRHLPDSTAGLETLTQALAWINTRLYCYNFQGIADWREVLDTFRYAATHVGVKLFILDSVMRIGIGDDDYAMQGFASAAFAQFALEHDAHLFLVIHENKGKGDGKAKIRGSKLWSANVHNIVRVERNAKKGEKLDDLTHEIGKLRAHLATEPGADRDGAEAEIRKLEAQRGEWATEWDTHVVLQKQRFPGTQQNASKFFHFSPDNFQFREKHSDTMVDWLKRWTGVRDDDDREPA